MMFLSPGHLAWARWRMDASLSLAPVETGGNGQAPFVVKYSRWRNLKDLHQCTNAANPIRQSVFFARYGSTMKPTLAVIAAVLAVVALLYVATVPTATPEMAEAEITEAELAQIEAEVMAFAEDHLTAFEELSSDRLMGFWAEGSISSVSFNQRVVGSEEMVPFYENLVTLWTTTEMEWLPGMVVDVISPDVALFQGTARQATTTAEGENELMTVHFTHLLKKVNGSWRIHRNHVSGGAITEG